MLSGQNRGDEPVAAVAHALRVDPLTVFDATEWQALAENASESNPFMEPWFAIPALRHLRDDGAVWHVTVRSNEHLIGVAHLCVHQGYGRMPVAYIGNWTHYQNFMGSPLVRAGYERTFWMALLDMLDRAPWAPSFLSLSGMMAHGPLHDALTRTGRATAIVHSQNRAMLESPLSGEDYLKQSLSGKKRKELRRLANRLEESGPVTFRVFSADDSLADWCDAFLTLEASGWKGSDGAALARATDTRNFFHAMMAGAHESGRLEFQRLDHDGKAIAMLVNFLTPPGSWSFKIAYDEGLARFSPGVMIELENLPRVLDRPDLDWMDSCAVEGHPMIDKIWRERRQIVQLTVPLAGAQRRLVHALCRVTETGSAFFRSLKNNKKIRNKDPDHG